MLALAAFELVDLHRWEEELELFVGLCLIASPFALGYATGGLFVWHLVLGISAILLTDFELWQDRGSATRSSHRTATRRR